VTLPIFAPMLASTQLPTAGAEWVFEPKLVGWRALVYVDGAVTVRTRSGRDITEYVDNLQALADVGRRFVLEGELVADSGRAGDFYWLGPNLRSSRRRDITFVAFDLLVVDDENLCDRPLRERRRQLDELDLVGPGWCTIRPLVGRIRELLEACTQLDVEGVVAKRVDSPYRPSVRSGDWLKLKTADWKRGHAPRRASVGVDRTSCAQQTDITARRHRCEESASTEEHFFHKHLNKRPSRRR
jgi:bifunctional non-homologous end joining protein LigD